MGSLRLIDIAMARGSRTLPNVAIERAYCAEWSCALLPHSIYRLDLHGANGKAVERADGAAAFMCEILRQVVVVRPPRPLWPARAGVVRICSNSERHTRAAAHLLPTVRVK